LRRLYPRACPVNRSVSARTKPTIDQLRRDQCIQNGVRCRSACWWLRITALQTPSGTHPHFQSQHSTGYGKIAKLLRSLTPKWKSWTVFRSRVSLRRRPARRSLLAQGNVAKEWSVYRVHGKRPAARAKALAQSSAIESDHVFGITQSALFHALMRKSCRLHQ
jgi:hypothetical protein